MELTHYHALFAGYITAMILWSVAARMVPSLWPKEELPPFKRPWLEVLFALLSVVAVILVGMLYTNGLLIPSSGSLEPITESLNQILIFSPVLLLLVIRKHSPKTAWLPMQKVWARFAIGTVIALVSILAFTLTRTGSDSWLTVVPRVYTPENFGMFVQVLLEDITIAVLFVRFSAVFGKWPVIALVAILFAAGHIPAMLSTGEHWSELTSLILDAVLGITVLTILQRSSDVWWFCCVHFAMDMMQFHSIPAQ